MKWTLAVLAVSVLAIGLLSAAGRAGLPDEAELLARGAQIVDVRTVEEYAAGHVDGALNIPVQELDRRTSELRKDKPVVVYCRSGNRSAYAKRILEGAGFPEVHDFGPMSAWKPPAKK